MCIVYLAISAHPEWPLFIAANRDEFHQRPCIPAAPWQDRPDIISGIDSQAKGSWLGFTRQGRYALITNYRDPTRLISKAPSRGELVSLYLASDSTPDAYAKHVHQNGMLYNGFNLIVGDANMARYVGNCSSKAEPTSLNPGRYIISNHLLNTPWPKANRLRLALDKFPLEDLEHSLTPVFDILKDSVQAQDHTLPETGLSIERERLLSSPFIISPDYGTRCSTIIAVHISGRTIFSEASYDESGTCTQRHDWPFSVSS